MSNKSIKEYIIFGVMVFLAILATGYLFMHAYNFDSYYAYKLLESEANSDLSN